MLYLIKVITVIAGIPQGLEDQLHLFSDLIWQLLAVCKYHSSVHFQNV